MKNVECKMKNISCKESKDAKPFDKIRIIRVSELKMQNEKFKIRKENTKL